VAPVAYGVLAQIAGMAVISLFIGAILGAMVWKLKRGLLWGALGVVVYMVVAPPLCDAPPMKFVRLYAAPMILTFLGALLIARRLHARNASVLRAALAGFAGGLVLGLLYMLLFRALLWTDMWAPVWIALVADVGLVAAAVRQQKTWQR